MLWALLRLSVRRRVPQLRYRRVDYIWSGLTRSDGAGTGSRARPEIKGDRAPWLIAQALYPALLPGNMRSTDGPGKSPGRPPDRDF